MKTPDELKRGAPELGRARMKEAGKRASRSRKPRAGTGWDRLPPALTEEDRAFFEQVQKAQAARNRWLIIREVEDPDW